MKRYILLLWKPIRIKAAKGSFSFQLQSLSDGIFIHKKCTVSSPPFRVQVLHRLDNYDLQGLCNIQQKERHSLQEAFQSLFISILSSVSDLAALRIHGVSLHSGELSPALDMNSRDM